MIVFYGKKCISKLVTLSKNIVHCLKNSSVAWKYFFRLNTYVCMYVLCIVCLTGNSDIHNNISSSVSICDDTDTTEKTGTVEQKHRTKYFECSKNHEIYCHLHHHQKLFCIWIAQFKKSNDMISGKAFNLPNEFRNRELQIILTDQELNFYM